MNKNTTWIFFCTWSYNALEGVMQWKKQCNQTYYNLNDFLFQYLYLVYNLSISQIFWATFYANSYELDKEVENATYRKKSYFNNGKYAFQLVFICAVVMRYYIYAESQISNLEYTVSSTTYYPVFCYLNGNLVICNYMISFLGRLELVKRAYIYIHFIFEKWKRPYGKTSISPSHDEN